MREASPVEDEKDAIRVNQKALSVYGALFFKQSDHLTWIGENGKVALWPSSASSGFYAALLMVSVLC